jgi:rhodanese-related sulfurtransferase
MQWKGRKMTISKRLVLFSLMLLAVLAFSTGAMVFAQDAAPAATEEVPFDIQPVLVDYLQNLPEGFYGVKPEVAFKELGSGTKPFLIDVRDEKDIRDGGYIAGAVLIPVRTLTQSLDMLPAQGEPILVYCGIGHRGAIAAEVLSLLGYTNVRSIFGGFAGWKAAGLPVETGMPASAVVSDAPVPEFDQVLFNTVDEFITTMPDDFYAVSPAPALKSLGAEPVPFLIDVRGEQELKDNGYIDGQVNIPIKTLLDDLDKLPADKDQPIIVYCAIGHRGAMALTTLRLLGYTDVKSIGGGFNNWVTNGLPFVKPGGTPVESA